MIILIIIYNTNMKKENKLNKKEIFQESKRLFKITMKNYLKYWTILFIFGITIILLFFYLSKDTFSYLSWAVVIINIFVTTLFLVIFDGIPARRIRKGGFAIEGMSKEKGMVFYNALRLRTIFRGLLNSIGTIVSIIIVVILMFT